MRGRNIKYILVAVVLLALGFGVGRLSAAGPTVDINGATQADVLLGTTAWGLTSEGSGPITGTMPNNGAVTMVPTTTIQTIAAGYHNGAGYVEGDIDLVASNIISGVSIFGVTGTYPRASGVPKTGARNQFDYTEVTGEDGHADVRKGAAWPSPRFTDNGDGTVTDDLTGLIWLQDADCLGAGTWDDALTQIDNLNAGTDLNCDNYAAGAFSDWRLPNVRELQSLIHYGVYRPAVPNTAGTGRWAAGDPFTGVHSSCYWSSTTRVEFTDYAWHVGLLDGEVHLARKGVTADVWAVRGGL